jgi:hypothetical protein
MRTVLYRFPGDYIEKLPQWSWTARKLGGFSPVPALPTMTLSAGTLTFRNWSLLMIPITSVEKR